MSSPTPINLGPSSWFDAFRDNGGPVLYSSMNRTPAIEDIRNILIYISFTTFFVAFLIIFPGIRKERCSTFICVTTSLFIGAVILISNFGSNWHVAKGSIAGPYRAFSKEKIYANVGVHIGLDSVNITLKALPLHQHYEDINYNERFYWIAANQMKHEFQRALAKGLPYPILTISEYLSQDGEGFNWGRHYRLAGYYTSITLWLAFSTWILMNILLCAVPRYGAYTMQLTGALMLLSNFLYVSMIPTKPLRIPFEGSTLVFSYGWCFWLVFSAGITAVFIGATVSIVDILFPNKFSTILEVDYDTPYRYFVGNDIHIIGSLPPPLNAYYYHHQHQSSLSTTASHQSSSHHLYQKKKTMSNIKHYSAAKTASITTNSSCCGTGSTTQLTHRIATKTKSDASTCTRDDSIIPEQMKMSTFVDENHPNKQQQHHLQTFITAADVEHEPNNNSIIVSNYTKDSVQRTTMDGFDSTINELTFDKQNNNNNNNNSKQFAFENQAYQADEVASCGDHQHEERQQQQNIHLKAAFDQHRLSDTNPLFIDNEEDEKLSAPIEPEQLQEGTGAVDHEGNDVEEFMQISTHTPLVIQKSSSSASSMAVASSDDEESDVSTTIIDGKRAISLSNFGKFAEQREKREGFIHRPMMMGATFGHPMASAGFRAIKNGFSKRVQKHQYQVRTAGASSSSSSMPMKTMAMGKKPGSKKDSTAATMNSSNNKLITNTSSSSSVGSSFHNHQHHHHHHHLQHTSSSSLPSDNNNNNKSSTTAKSSSSTDSSSVRVDLSSAAAMW